MLGFIFAFAAVLSPLPIKIGLLPSLTKDIKTGCLASRDYMKQVALKFPSIIELVDFTLAIDAEDCEVKRSKLVLVCNLIEADIELAKQAFKAQVIQMQPM